MGARETGVTGGNHGLPQRRPGASKRATHEMKGGTKCVPQDSGKGKRGKKEVLNKNLLSTTLGFIKLFRKSRPVTKRQIK